MKWKCTWKAAGWMERERSLLLWRSRYSRFRTDVRASPGMLRMEFFSRWSSTRLRGIPLGTTLRLLFDKSRHSRLLSWLPGEKRKSTSQFFDAVLCVFSLKLQPVLVEWTLLFGTHLKTNQCNYNERFSFLHFCYVNPWGFVSEVFFPPESLVVHALIREEVVLEIQLSEVWQVIKGPRWDFLQFVAL